MQPTEEQVKAVELFSTEASIAIEAGAGSGKTSTCILMANSNPGRRGQYVAFNKAIVEEAKTKMPASVNCNTAHSLAYRAVGFRYRNRMDMPRVKSATVARYLKLSAVSFAAGDAERMLSAGWLASHVNKSLAAFCNSADPEPTEKHILYVDGLDLPDDKGKRTYRNNNDLAKHLAPALKKAWEDVQQETGTIRFTADHYLKMWQLSRPEIAGDYLLFDEAQDASPVMLDVISQQKSQVVWVGDTQQQIYAWRGAVNALAGVKSDHRTFLTQSFRFGQPIADIANLLLDKLEADLRLSGRGGPSTVEKLEEPFALLCRTNAGCFREFAKMLERGKRVHLVGGGRELMSFSEAAIDLKAGRQVYHPELSCFSSWGDVCDYVEQDPEGGDLLLMVRLINEFGAETILRTLSSMPTEANADAVVSTVHKAKGKEWNTVALGGDFPDSSAPEELRLLYVAATRARKTLDISRCQPLLDIRNTDSLQERFANERI